MRRNDPNYEFHQLDRIDRGLPLSQSSSSPATLFALLAYLTIGALGAAVPPAYRFLVEQVSQLPGGFVGPAFVLAALVAGGVLRWLQTSALRAFAALEVGFGIGLAYDAGLSLTVGPTTSIAPFLALAAAAYVILRGFTNWPKKESAATPAAQEDDAA